MRGEAGVGKSALLGYLFDRVAGWRVATAAGVESEMELAYSGLHQLCASLLDHLDRLPAPQRDALATVFGLSAGPAPDRFLVGLATLSIFAEAADGQPLVCIVDDAHWLDSASEQILGFVGRRLLAERIAIVCCVPTGVGDGVLAELPEMHIRGLDDRDARALLLAHMHGPIDAAVCEQIVVESHGNPLALLELPRTWNAADLAGGFALPDGTVAGKIEQSYAERFLQLPLDTQLLGLAAAAESLGDPSLLHRATEILGVGMASADPLVDAGLLQMRARVEFAHPLVRSAAYHAATADDRHRVHQALADATDPATDPDRRAWHRARATQGLDEDVAADLERSAGRAQSRGGLAAAAGVPPTRHRADPPIRRFVLRAPSPLLSQSTQAGASDAALRLLGGLEAGALDELQRARVHLLHAQIAFGSSHGRDAPPLLLAAARELEHAGARSGAGHLPRSASSRPSWSAA